MALRDCRVRAGTATDANRRLSMGHTVPFDIAVREGGAVIDSVLRRLQLLYLDPGFMSQT